MGVAVQRLSLDLRRPRGESAQQLDPRRALDGVEHVLCLARVSSGRELILVIQQCVMDGAETATGHVRIEVAARNDVAPEDHDASAVPVRTRIDLVGRRDHRRARAQRALRRGVRGRRRPEPDLRGRGRRWRHGRRPGAVAGGRVRARRLAERPGPRTGARAGAPQRPQRRSPSARSRSARGSASRRA